MQNIKNICSKYGINTYFKGNRTIKNIPVSPKANDPIQQKVMFYTGLNVTEWILMRNIWESSRTFGERYKEHLKAPIHGHQSTNGHPTTMDNFSIQVCPT